MRQCSGSGAIADRVEETATVQFEGSLTHGVQWSEGRNSSGGPPNVMIEFEGVFGVQKMAV